MSSKNLPRLVGLDMFISGMREETAGMFHLLIGQEFHSSSEGGAMLHGLITYNQMLLTTLAEALDQAQQMPTERGRLEMVRARLQTRLELDSVALEDLRLALGGQ